jgi:hypothetical protein
MAAPLSRWIPAAFAMAIGCALGWLAEPVLTPDLEAHNGTGLSDKGDLTRKEAIGSAWLPLSELEEQLQSISAAELSALLAKLEPRFWCGHPNGRDALRIVVRRLAEQNPPAELTRELFGRFASWELPAGVRAEALRNLAAALVMVPGVTPEMIGESLRGYTKYEIRAAAAGFVGERRGESLERDAAAVRQLLLAAGLKGDELVSMAAELAAAAWFHEQPEAAIAFAVKNAPVGNSEIFRPMLRQLYAVNPAAAVAALKLAASNAKSSYWTGESALLTGLSAAEFRDVLSQVPKDERLNCLQGFAIELALQAPGNVLELAQQFSAAELYPQQVHEKRSDYSGLLRLLPLFAQRDAARCREWLNSLSTERRLKLLEDTAVSTPSGNAEFARLCLSDPEFQLSATSAFQILSAITGKDLNAALRELPRVPEDERLNVEAALHGKAILDRNSGDIAGVLEALEQLPESLRRQVRTDIYPSLAQRYQTQLKEWIASNPDAPEAKALQIQLANHDAFLSNAQREALLAQALPSINEYPGVASVAESYISFLAQTDPSSAVEWFARIPDGERKVSVAHRIAERWAVTDMASAVAWAEQLPPSPSRDGAFIELVAKQKSDPAEALQQVAQIGDGERRFGAALLLVQEWALADHERAIAIIAEAPLSEDQRSKLHEIVESSPTRIRSKTAAP